MESTPWISAISTEPRADVTPGRHKSVLQGCQVGTFAGGLLDRSDTYRYRTSTGRLGARDASRDPFGKCDHAQQRVEGLCDHYYVGRLRRLLRPCRAAIGRSIRLRSTRSGLGDLAFCATGIHLSHKVRLHLTAQTDRATIRFKTARIPR